MVMKIMAQQQFCQGCKLQNNCQSVYRQLGHTKSPSVVAKVVLAFLLPLTVFITALAAFEKILTSIIIAEKLQTAFGFLLALAVTSLSILIIKAIGKTRKNLKTKRTKYSSEV